MDYSHSFPEMKYPLPNNVRFPYVYSTTDHNLGLGPRTDQNIKTRRVAPCNSRFPERNSETRNIKSTSDQMICKKPSLKKDQRASCKEILTRESGQFVVYCPHDSDTKPVTSRQSVLYCPCPDDSDTKPVTSRQSVLYCPDSDTKPSKKIKCCKYSPCSHHEMRSSCSAKKEYKKDVCIETDRYGVVEGLKRCSCNLNTEAILSVLKSLKSCSCKDIKIEKKLMFDKETVEEKGAKVDLEDCLIYSEEKLKKEKRTRKEKKLPPTPILTLEPSKQEIKSKPEDSLLNVESSICPSTDTTTQLTCPIKDKRVTVKNVDEKPTEEVTPLTESPQPQPGPSKERKKSPKKDKSKKVKEKPKEGTPITENKAKQSSEKNSKLLKRLKAMDILKNFAAFSATNPLFLF